MDSDSHVAFVEGRCVGAGPLRDVLAVLKRRHDKDPGDMTLVFTVDTGRQVDFDLTGSLEEVLERYDATTARGPGRPRLGVTSREVSLLPRHWDWLEKQPQGISAALRRLVEAAIKLQPGKERARLIRAATSSVLTSIAGNRPKFEEATRALYSGDVAQFEKMVERWPRDIRTFALERMAEAAREEKNDHSPRIATARTARERET